VIFKTEKEADCAGDDTTGSEGKFQQPCQPQFNFISFCDNKPALGIFHEQELRQKSYSSTETDYAD